MAARVESAGDFLHCVLQHRTKSDSIEHARRDRALPGLQNTLWMRNGTVIWAEKLVLCLRLHAGTIIRSFRVNRRAAVWMCTTGIRSTCCIFLVLLLSSTWCMVCTRQASFTCVQFSTFLQIFFYCKISYNHNVALRHTQWVVKF